MKAPWWIERQMYGFYTSVCLFICLSIYPSIQLSLDSLTGGKKVFEKILGFICGRYRSKLGKFSARTCLELQYKLSFNYCHYTVWIAFRRKGRAPSFPNEDIRQIHYGETSAAEWFNLLQKLRSTEKKFNSINMHKNILLKSVTKF